MQRKKKKQWGPNEGRQMGGVSPPSFFSAMHSLHPPPPPPPLPVCSAHPGEPSSSLGWTPGGSSRARSGKEGRKRGGKKKSCLFDKVEPLALPTNIGTTCRGHTKWKLVMGLGCVCVCVCVEIWVALLGCSKLSLFSTPGTTHH